VKPINPDWMSFANAAREEVPGNAPEVSKALRSLSLPARTRGARLVEGAEFLPLRHPTSGAPGVDH